MTQKHPRFGCPDYSCWISEGDYRDRVVKFSRATFVIAELTAGPAWLPQYVERVGRF